MSWSASDTTHEPSIHSPTTPASKRSRSGGPRLQSTASAPRKTPSGSCEPAPEHWTYLLERGFKAFTRPTLPGDAVGCVRWALRWLDERVDVVDCGEFPLANYPHYAGVDAEKAFAVLEEALAGETVGGFAVTEINPNNDPEDVMLERVVRRIAAGMPRRRLDGRWSDRQPSTLKSSLRASPAP